MSSATRATPAGWLFTLVALGVLLTVFSGCFKRDSTRADWTLERMATAEQLNTIEMREAAARVVVSSGRWCAYPRKLDLIARPSAGSAEHEFALACQWGDRTARYVIAMNVDTGQGVVRN